jgi:hypothetical protein
MGQIIIDPALFAAGYSLIVFDYMRERSKITSSFGVLVPPGKGRIKVLIIRLAVVMQGVILLPVVGRLQVRPNTKSKLVYLFVAFST